MSENGSGVSATDIQPNEICRRPCTLATRQEYTHPSGRSTRDGWGAREPQVEVQPNTSCRAQVRQGPTRKEAPLGALPHHLDSRCRRSCIQDIRRCCTPPESPQPDARPFTSCSSLAKRRLVGLHKPRRPLHRRNNCVGRQVTSASLLPDLLHASCMQDRDLSPAAGNNSQEALRHYTRLGVVAPQWRPCPPALLRKTLLASHQPRSSASRSCCR